MDYLSDKLDKLSLEDIYEQTSFNLLDPLMTLKCGQLHPYFDDHLERLNKRSWTIITATNPGNIRETKKKNESANADLEIDLARSGTTYARTRIHSVVPNSPVEDGFVVYDMPIDQALILARRYQQDTILVGRIGRCSKLAWTRL